MQWKKLSWWKLTERRKVMIKVVGIGANVYDTLITVPYYPKEDTKLRVTGILESGGGPCGTGLVAAAKLGAEAAYIGAIAKDGGGEFLLGDMKRFGVSTEFVDVVEGKSSFSSYIVLSEEAATRTCVFNKENLPSFVIDEKKAEAIRNAEVLMVDGNDLENAIEGAKIAKENGTKVLYDAGGLYEGIEGLIPYADILIPSEEFALAYTKAETAEDAIKILYEKYSPEVVVITQGVKGGIIYDGEEIKSYPSFKVDAVDSNGAGDVFHGAFAFSVVCGYDYYDACVFSSAVSALKCTRLGARDGVPTFDEAIKFLKERGYNV